MGHVTSMVHGQWYMIIDWITAFAGMTRGYSTYFVRFHVKCLCLF